MDFLAQTGQQAFGASELTNLSFEESSEGSILDPVGGGVNIEQFGITIGKRIKGTFSADQVRDQHGTYNDAITGTVDVVLKRVE